MATKKKPEAMTIAEYNNLMMEDALRMLLEAVSDMEDATLAADSARDGILEARRKLTEVYEQMRLDV